MRALFHRHDHPAVKGRGQNVMELAAKPLKGWGVDHQRIVRVQLDFQAVAGHARPIVMFKIAHEVGGVVERDPIGFNKRRKNRVLLSTDGRDTEKQRTCQATAEMEPSKLPEVIQPLLLRLSTRG